MASSDQEDIFQVVSKRLSDAHQIFKEEKFDEALNFYTPSFMSLYPGYELIKGDKKALKSFFEKCFVGGGPDYEVNLERVSKLGEDNAFHVTTVKYFDKDGNVVQKLKACVLWEKRDGEWYIDVDCCNATNIAGQSVLHHKK